MIRNLDIRKYKLIQEIIQLNNEDDLISLETQLQSIQQKEMKSIWEAIKPIRPSVSLEELISE